MTDITEIGDVHLGKTFKNGVPLNRRGEYEEIIWKEFERRLQTARSHGIVIQLGDLFDKFTISIDVLLRAYFMIKKNATESMVPHYFIAGNHDLAKDTEKKSSFQLLSILFFNDADTKGLVHFVGSEGDGEIKTIFTLEGEYIHLVPYYYGEESLPDRLYGLNLNTPGTKVYGHFDEPFDPFLLGLSCEVITGHIHTPGQVKNIRKVGSILPYTHGEDPKGQRFITTSLTEVMSEPSKFKDKFVRIVLQKGELPLTDLDCLGLIFMKEGEEDLSETEVNFEKFDFEGLFRECLADTGLADKAWDMYLEKTRESIDG